MLVIFALGNAKVLAFALDNAKLPNASSFAFWWNIGFSVLVECKEVVSLVLLNRQLT